MFFLILFGLFLIGLVAYLILPYIVMALVFPFIIIVRGKDLWTSPKVADRLAVILWSFFLLMLVTGIIIELV